MKKLFLFILLASVGLEAGATMVMVPVYSLFGNAQYAKPIYINAAYPLTTDGTNFFAGTTLPVTGINTNPVVNLQPNDYLITFPDSRQPLRISVPYSTNVLNALALASNARVYNFTPPWLGDQTNTLSAASNAVVTGLWPAPGGGGGGGSLWISTPYAIYPGGNTGTNGGWIFTSSAIYPQ